jgi:hypothetical protein
MIATAGERTARESVNEHKNMKTIKPAALIMLPAILLLGSCTTRGQLETETTTPSSSLRSSTRVVKDEIPAEGERKIPVVEQY